MELTTNIPVRKNPYSKLNEVDFDHLEFGKYVSDHMLVCDYGNGAWKTAQIVPYANLSLSPTTLGLHYGQTVFEGMKAFRMKDGRINIFRIDRHYDRFVKSLHRMCMAVPPREIFIEGLMQLIELDKAWVPSKSGEALYIRPFVYASEAKFGVKISDEYRFIIFGGPVPSLYSNPIKVKVETHYARAAKGGTGFAKCGGNYGGAYYPTLLAKNEGYDQVLWTDARENKFIEESGMMNAMFVIGNKLVTPPLSDSILDGVTRNSLLTLAVDMGFETDERPVSIDELEQAFKNKTITEAFGAGTAAVVAPIQTININGGDYNLPAYSIESLHNKLKDQLELIRTGQVADVHEWNCIVG
ncbi:MAG: branched-chain amino acid aminotransferase [Chitinophagaceae bacterium]|nr:branched-chain amino acid aminotransferase [Chitinophagaceae bacterium]